MPRRITRVRHAQQRYVMIPVTDPATGQPKVISAGKTTRKTGRAVTMRVTAPDLNQPLPPLKCEVCDAVIQPKSSVPPVHAGDPYKWIEAKTGPYSSYKHIRCTRCPDWQPWELSNALWAQLARISHDFHQALWRAEAPDDVRDALGTAAAEVRDLADEKRESAESLESGFGHETPQSQELNDTADQLESWADEIEQADVPELPEPDDADAETEDAASERLDTWRDEVESEVTIIDETPV